MWIVNPHPHLQVFGDPIPAIDILGIQRYLGVPLSPMRTRADIAGKLTEGLENLSRAPLKPQQWLFFLNTNLIPSLYHQLVLTATSKKYLKWLDRSIRAAVRSWLRLQFAQGILPCQDLRWRPWYRYSWLDPQLGVEGGELRVNAGAFADDITLIARRSGGLQYQLGNLAAGFALPHPHLQVQPAPPSAGGSDSCN